VNLPRKAHSCLRLSLHAAAQPKVRTRRPGYKDVDTSVIRQCPKLSRIQA
jgi:hypothetical protein